MIKEAAGKNDMSKRILVVDDQPDNRQIIRDMLAPTDYEITEAENGELALAAIAKQRPDLILMVFSSRSWTVIRTMIKSGHWTLPFAQNVKWL